MKKMILVFLLPLIVIVSLCFIFVYYHHNVTAPRDYMAKSIFEINMFHKKSVPPRNGWFESKDGKYYYLKGKKVSGWMKIGNHWYYFEERGLMAKGWIEKDGRYYLDNDTGARLDGLQNINGETYYFDSDTGVLLSSQWLLLDGNEYYLTEKGNFAKGIVSTGAGDYYFDESSGEVLVDLSKPIINLSFDDGPSNLTPALLDILDEEGAKVSFFFLGSKISGKEDYVKRIYESGHSIGNHSYNHPNFRTISEEEAKHQVEETDKEINFIIGRDSDWFRTPYGETSESVIKLVGKPTIHWNIDSEDWKGYTSDEIKESVLYYARDGGIVLMHDTLETTVEATKKIIPELKKLGYQFVNLEIFFKAKGIEIESNQLYYGL